MGIQITDSLSWFMPGWMLPMLFFFSSQSRTRTACQRNDATHSGLGSPTSITDPDIAATDLSELCHLGNPSPDSRLSQSDKFFTSAPSL